MALPIGDDCFREGQLRSSESLSVKTENWDGLDIDSRRRLVQALAKEIKVWPALRGRNFYSPDRVKVEYRQ
jgi:hypothetical protein